AGVVETVGVGVTHVAPGDRVVFSIVPSCRECRECRRGRLNLCLPAGKNGVRGTLLDGTSRLRLPDGAPLQHGLLTACFAELAAGAGGTHVLQGGAATIAGRVARLAEGGVEHAFEVVGRPETMRLAWDVLRPGGTAVVVGLAPKGGEVSLPAIEFLSDKGIRG